MQAHQSRRSEARFEDYSLDLRSGELRHKKGKIVRLPEQSFQILTMLLEHPGEVLSREEVRQRLWPEDTFVEFEHSISAAMHRLRQALGDSAENPRFIETLAKRGYRFKCPVESDESSSSVLLSRPADLPSSKGRSRPGPYSMPAAVCLLLSILAAFLWVNMHRTSPLPVLRQRQLTVNPAENPLNTGAISPDGKYLAYADLNGLHIKLLDTGEVKNIVEPDFLRGQQVDWVPVWLPDNSTLLANANVPGQGTSIWIASVVGGTLHKIRDNATAWSVSRDGSSVAFTANTGSLGDREVWVMGPLGENARKLFEVTGNNDLERVAWAPNGQRLAYMTSSPQTGQPPAISIESRDINGGTPFTLVPSTPSENLLDYAWLSDGRIVYASEGGSTNVISCNLWDVPIDDSSGKPFRKPKRLTDWAGFCLGGISATLDSRHLAFRKWFFHDKIAIADLQAGGTQISNLRLLTSTDANESPYAWSPDSKVIVFRSNRNGRAAIFRQALDADTPELILMRPKDATMSAPAVSPDGKWVFYGSDLLDQPPSVPDHVMRIPFTGGGPQLLFSANLHQIPRCAIASAALCLFAERSSDQKRLTFTSFDALKGRGHELCTIDVDPAAAYNWAVSPDGTRLALIREPHRDGPIEIYDLDGRSAQSIHVRSLDGFDVVGMDWTAGGDGLYIGARLVNGAVLERVDLRGNVHVLINDTALDAPIWGIESPDRRHLAIQEHISGGNIWIIDNF